MMKSAGICSKQVRNLLVLLLALLAAASMAMASPLPVNLGTAGNFTILSKAGISTIGTTSIVGNIGVSPAPASYITGFGLTADASNQFSTSSLVNGSIYAANYAPPTPAIMTTAIGDMQTAFTDAAGRAPDFTGLGAGEIGGMTLTSGVYKWSTGLSISTDVFLSGSSEDVWIFQIAQTLVIASGKQVILSGGAQAKNIFWQVSGQATLGTTSVFNGNILGQTAIVMNTGATLNGKALAQTAVTLDANSVVSSAAGYLGLNPPSKGKTFAFPSPAKGDSLNVAYNMSGGAGKVAIRIWNENGDLVAKVEENKPAGPQKSWIPIRDFSSGIYIYKVVMTYDSGSVEKLDAQKFGVAK
jgi:hypothetical protein